jgi:threonine/homoserine/homoserine lactone efflux protein
MNPGVELLAFAGVMLLGQFSPGPDMVLLTRTALAGGAAAGVRMALGIGTGLTLHAAVAIAGSAWIFARAGGWRPAMRWIAAAYLLWLAGNLVRAGWRGANAPPAQAPDSRAIGNPYWRGLCCNLLNPKVVLFLAAVTASFLPGADRPDWWPWALWGIVAVQGAGAWSLWVLVLQAPPIRRLYRRFAPWLDIGFGLVLGLLALGLVFGA